MSLFTFCTYTTRNVIDLNGFGNLVVARDFNQDGQLDLAIADDLGRVGVWLRDFGLAWYFKRGELYVTGAGSYGVIAEDFDGDGFLDLAVSNTEADTVSILAGNGDGTFRQPATLTAGKQSRGLAAGDFNDDGFLDLAVANAGEQTVTVYYNTPTK